MAIPSPGPGVDPPIEPPAGPAPSSPSSTPEPTASPAPSTPAPNGTEGGGGLLGSGWDLLAGALEGFVESLADGVGVLVDIFHGRLLTLPASGVAGDPSTWVPPSDPYWQAAFIVYAMLSVFVLPLIWSVGWFNVGFPRGGRRRDRLKTLALAFVLIVAGGVFLQAWIHLWNEAALAFAPSSEEFLATPGSTAKLGLGVALGAALLFFKAIVVLAGLVIHALFVILTYLFVAVWPLSVGLYATGVWPLDGMGTAGITGTLVLPILQFAKALVLRLVFEFPLDATDPATAWTFVLVLVGVTVAFVAIPYVGLKRLLPRMIVAAGGRAGQRGGQRVSELRERAPSSSELRERLSVVQTRENSRLGRRAPGSSLQARRGTGDVDRNAPFGGTDRTHRQQTDTRTRTRSD